MDIKSEYRKERKRILSAIRRYIKKGYNVELKVPIIPKKITEASIRRLKKITIGEIRKKSFAPDLESGEKINYNQYKIRYPRANTPAKEYERFTAGTPHMYELAIDYVEDVIGRYPDKMRELFEGRLKSAFARHSRKEVGYALQEMIDDGEIVSEKESYNYEAVLHMANQLVRYLDFNKEEMKIIDESMAEYYYQSEEYEDEYSEW